MNSDKQTKYTQAIWQITEQLREAEELDEALSNALTVILECIGCEAGSVWFLHKDSNRVQAAFNIGTESIAGISVENGQGIVGQVTKTGESIIVEDTSKDERFSSSVDEEMEFVTRSIICAPLKDQYETIGAIELINKLDGNSFDKDDLSLCEQLASLAAIAIGDRGLAIGEIEEKRTIISLRDIKKEYQVGDGVLQVLRGINLDIYENEFLVVLGESGCGKSTMMNIVGGMDFPTSGSLTIEGKDFSTPDEKALTQYRRDYVGFIFQSYNLMPNLTALQNVQFIAEISKNPMDPAVAIEKVGLASRADNYPSQMSGGQQQRVSIARAIVKNPTLILADEPTAALDFTTSIEVLTVIEDIVKNQGTSVMMITHNTEIAKMANRVVKLKNGQVSSIRLNMHPLSASDLSW